MPQQTDPKTAGASTMRLKAATLARLRCPVCRAPVSVSNAHLSCDNVACATRYPIVDGIPVLINEARSVFVIEEFVNRRDATGRSNRSLSERVLGGMLEVLPDISASFGTRENYGRFRDELLAANGSAKVLVLGGSILGQGMEPLTRDARVELVSTDVAVGPMTEMICDAHDIPFEDGVFDGVVVQAVLEHVVDPHRCVDEIHRVLRDGGLVFAETPFMQQVHMGAYDFTRFTHSGHRRLFRRFAEVASGPSTGPGMALAWAYQYFLLSFTTNRPLRGLLRAFARVTSFYLKYFNSFLVRRRSAIDAASGFYFVGRKSGTTLSDAELVRYYRGGGS